MTLSRAFRHMPALDATLAPVISGTRLMTLPSMVRRMKPTSWPSLTGAISGPRYTISVRALCFSWSDRSTRTGSRATSFTQEEVPPQTRASPTVSLAPKSS